MDLGRKLQHLQQSVRSISTHRDQPVAMRVDQLKAVLVFIENEINRIENEPTSAETATGTDPSTSGDDTMTTSSGPF
jgi:hypothetical protein